MITLPNDLATTYSVSRQTFNFSAVLYTKPVDYGSRKDALMLKGDRLIIKRDGVILTPGAGKEYREFAVIETPQTVYIPGEFDIHYQPLVKVVK